MHENSAYLNVSIRRLVFDAAANEGKPRRLFSAIVALDHIKQLDTADDCQLVLVTTAGIAVSGNSLQPNKDPTLQDKFAACIATDDPRLVK